MRQKQWQTVKWWYCKTVVCRNLSCSIKEGRKQSHPRSQVASAKMSSNWKKNSTWSTPAPKSPSTKNKTSQAVNCSTHSYGSDPFKRSNITRRKRRWFLKILIRKMKMPREKWQLHMHYQDCELCNVDFDDSSNIQDIHNL